MVHRPALNPLSQASQGSHDPPRLPTQGGNHSANYSQMSQGFSETRMLTNDSCSVSEFPVLAPASLLFPGLGSFGSFFPMRVLSALASRARDFIACPCPGLGTGNELDRRQGNGAGAKVETVQVSVPDRGTAESLPCVPLEMELRFLFRQVSASLH